MQKKVEYFIQEGFLVFHLKIPPKVSFLNISKEIQTKINQWIIWLILYSESQKFGSSIFNNPTFKNTCSLTFLFFQSSSP